MSDPSSTGTAIAGRTSLEGFGIAPYGYFGVLSQDTALMYVKFRGVSSGSDTGAICSFCAMIARSAPYDAYVIVSIGGSQSSLVSHSTNYLSFKIGQVIPAPTLLNSGIGRRLSECRKWYERSTMVESRPPTNDKCTRETAWISAIDRYPGSISAMASALRSK